MLVAQRTISAKADMTAFRLARICKLPTIINYMSAYLADSRMNALLVFCPRRPADLLRTLQAYTSPFTQGSQRAWQKPSKAVFTFLPRWSVVIEVTKVRPKTMFERTGGYTGSHGWCT